MLQDIGLVGVALAGCVVGAVAALLPGLHIYSVAAGLLIASSRRLLPLADEPLAMCLLGMGVGWAVVNVIPQVFLFAPDDASAAVVLPATKLLLRGRGAEAALWIGAGSLGAIAVLVATAPVLDEVLRPLRAILAPHLGWMLVAIIVFLLMGEWPRADERAARPWRRLVSAWAYLGAGLLTFALSGVLGLVLMYRSPVPLEAASQNLMPAFVGLFTIPGLVQALTVGRRIPPQASRAAQELAPMALLRGTLTGTAGGVFAGLLPVVSGGIGGLLAGHATAQRDDRLFLVSQGASKAAYYSGGLLLLFVPGLTLTRGGMAWMISTTYVPHGWRSYALAVAGTALSGALAFVLLLVFARGAAALAPRVSPRAVAAAALVLAFGLTAVFTGPGGLAVACVAAATGMIPVFVGGRRMNCLGVLLIPIMLNVVGAGPVVAMWLGLA